MAEEAERLRRARLASALRENLRRRKAQLRNRSEVASEGGLTESRASRAPVEPAKDPGD